MTDSLIALPRVSGRQGRAERVRRTEPRKHATRRVTPNPLNLRKETPMPEAIPLAMQEAV